MELGYRREERLYTPHLTIGRVKGDSHMDQLSLALEKRSSWAAGEIDVDEVLVMSSDLRPEGPVYSVLSTSKLGKRGEPEE